MTEEPIKENSIENNAKTFSNNDENFENFDKIEIFSNTDERLKFLGKILNNDFSRQILLLLAEKEMTANEIANQTKLSLPLVLHHVNQMLKAEMVVVSKISTNSKNQPMKYYSAKSGIVILPENVVERAKNSKSLYNSLKRIMRFAAIGIASIATWSYLKLIESTTKVQLQGGGQERTEIPDPLVVALTVIIIGLCGELIYLKIKKKD
ncbi:MAG TPA: winged helix-turn-helix domain-containing protein [Candidatus Nitrosotenuis sp.]|uniref:Putative ArsR family transcriptional regulator n=1 Tax=Candidatus Nitrosotenuis uzonensis TaxID=1407055 RepID=A0A812F3G1_9ARCH|nr:winged helix-turn-helix domain-containing protein [Candidatus Nitrosotenuis uzonensis]CAE6485544.1 putative ArsR family transcriptional regulator [Candidatus Nitrosotenuis uzonensis]HXG14581.1 winged helix-turn-helix domain-containing protein [Candidatus Nitrosotenuis sp.]